MSGEVALDYLQQIESIAQDILTAKDKKLELSNARNKYREAYRALEHSEERNTWLQTGSIYIQRPTKECISLLKEEVSNADRDIVELEQEIKTKVHQLQDLEHEPRLVGFSLKPLTAAEARALTSNFGGKL